MQVVSTQAEYDGLYRQWAGKKIALVPTMGALHAGHQALVRRARQVADVVVVSIFVNPLQFGPKEDLAKYPRPVADDLAICQALGVDAVFHPTEETMYPLGLEETTRVIPPESLTDQLCGRFRPGHFTGVATVVLMLFNILRPHMAVFGEKDAQQLMVIRRLVRDLHVPVEIVACPTVRAEDGLALSSRNSYLVTDVQRQAALVLYQTLSRVREKVQQADKPLPTKKTLNDTRKEVLAELGEGAEGVDVQYLEAVHADDFMPAKKLEPGVKVLMAAYVGNVRLIDNITL